MAGMPLLPAKYTLDASHDRLELAHQAGILEMGLDAAETIGAQNSAARRRSRRR
jgi:hypothetical protein